MRSPHATLLASLAIAVLTLGGCRLPGKPKPDNTPTRPDQVTNFDILYRQNCTACHGAEGQHGMAFSLASPAFIAYAGADHIAEVTAHGIGGTLMPAFAESDGGLLTDQQIEILAHGIVSRWGQPAALGGVTPPPYISAATGNAAAGETLFRNDCMHCHAPVKGSVLDPTYLALVSNGGLRTILVTGKPYAGMPDWRGYPGGPLSDQQLADLVTFMVSHRIANPGQPFPNAAGVPQSGNSAAENAAAERERRLAIQAGPATAPPGSNQTKYAAPPSRPLSKGPHPRPEVVKP